MIIELQKPYSDYWARGYLRFDKKLNRNMITFYSVEGRGKITSYARYLYSVYLGYEVPEEYEVDHINNDCSDDRIENLQLLTKEQNLYKQHWYYIMYQQVHYGCTCPNCLTPFLLLERDYNMKLKAGVQYAYCSIKCFREHNKFLINSGQRTTTHPNPSISKEIQSQIKSLRSQGLTGKAISEQLNLNRNTVMKYW